MLTVDWPETAIVIAVTLLVAILGRWVVVRAIRRVVANSIARADKRAAERPGVLARAAGLTHERHKQRTATMGSLLTNVATIVIVVLALLTIMSAVGLPLGPLLASAGIGGVALGFGAQSLVKDYLSGLFMLSEDQYGVGDLVDTGECKGTVEEVTLRITRLRDAEGVIWYVRNGEITRIANHSQGWSTAIIDLPVANDEAPAKAIAALRDAMTELTEGGTLADKLLDAPTVLGVESLSGNTMTLRIMARCEPNQQWGVQRVIREKGQEALAAAGVRAPRYPGLPPTP
ncbi:mechanosensitive ion channel family protein [Enemella sp. A6]|uniref:mechanosensitive ion channel family protein n=1 Tax=Enemella sp. A6 TaxID=3440152 RepID=UPI003EB717E2